MSSVGRPTLNKVVVELWMQPEDQELSTEPILYFLLHRLSTVTLPVPKVLCQNVLQTILSFSRQGIHAPSQQRFGQEAMWTTLGVQQHRSCICWTFTVAFFGTQITSCILFNPNWLLIFAKLAGICLFLRLLPSVKLVEIPQWFWKLVGKVAGGSMDALGSSTLWDASS